MLAHPKCLYSVKWLIFTIHHSQIGFWWFIICMGEKDKATFMWKIGRTTVFTSLQFCSHYTIKMKCFIIQGPTSKTAYRKVCFFLSAEIVFDLIWCSIFPLLVGIIRACSLYYGKKLIALSPCKIAAVKDKKQLRNESKNPDMQKDWILDFRFSGISAKVLDSWHTKSWIKLNNM